MDNSERKSSSKNPTKFQLNMEPIVSSTPNSKQNHRMIVKYLSSLKGRRRKGETSFYRGEERHNHRKEYWQSQKKSLLPIHYLSNSIHITNK